MNNPITLYHGSDVVVREPDPAYQRIHNTGNTLEYGYGFYTTDDPEIARLRGKAETEVNPDETVLNIYEFNEEKARNDLNVKVFDYNEEWLDFVLDNYEKHSNHDYDIAIGPLADDLATYMIKFYIEGWIGKELLLNNLKTISGMKKQFVFFPNRLDKNRVKDYLIFKGVE